MSITKLHFRLWTKLTMVYVIITFLCIVIFSADQWPEMGKEKEPDWVQKERETFTKWRDVNKVCGKSR